MHEPAAFSPYPGVPATGALVILPGCLEENPIEMGAQEPTLPQRVAFCTITLFRTPLRDPPSDELIRNRRIVFVVFKNGFVQKVCVHESRKQSLPNGNTDGLALRTLTLANQVTPVREAYSTQVVTDGFYKELLNYAQPTGETYTYDMVFWNRIWVKCYVESRFVVQIQMESKEKGTVGDARAQLSKDYEISDVDRRIKELTAEHQLAAWNYCFKSVIQRYQQDEALLVASAFILTIFDPTIAIKEDPSIAVQNTITNLPSSNLLKSISFHVFRREYVPPSKGAMDPDYKLVRDCYVIGALKALSYLVFQEGRFNRQQGIDANHLPPGYATIPFLNNLCIIRPKAFLEKVSALTKANEWEAFDPFQRTRFSQILQLASQYAHCDNHLFRLLSACEPETQSDFSESLILRSLCLKANQGEALVKAGTIVVDGALEKYQSVDIVKSLTEQEMRALPRPPALVEQAEAFQKAHSKGVASFITNNRLTLPQSMIYLKGVEQLVEATKTAASKKFPQSAPQKVTFEIFRDEDYPLFCLMSIYRELVPDFVYDESKKIKNGSGPLTPSVSVNGSLSAFEACRQGSLAEVKEWVDKGHLNDDIGDGYTAVHLARIYNKASVLRYLLPLNPLLGSLNSGKAAVSTPLYGAMSNQTLECFALLLEAGANPNEEIKEGMAKGPILLAAINMDSPNKLEAVNLLIARGADVNPKGQRSLLFSACCAGDPQVAEALLVRGAKLFDAETGDRSNLEKIPYIVRAYFKEKGWPLEIMFNASGAVEEAKAVKQPSDSPPRDKGTKGKEEKCVVS